MRKIKLAIVGPSDSVSLIEEVGQEFVDRIQLISCIYNDASEVPDTIARHDADVDIWIFSGIVPYRYAIAAANSTKPKLYVSHTGSSIYRVLLELSRQNRPISSMSFDTFSSKDIAETFSDAAVLLPKIYVKDYVGIVSAAELTDFHLALWKQGKAEVAVTCFLATYLELKRHGVNAFRIWPTRSNIRSILNLALTKADALFSKASQIAIQHIAIDEYDEFSREAVSGYAVLKVELQLQEILVRFAEQVQGAMISQGKGHFTIYSTRGAMEAITQGFSNLPVVSEISRCLSVGVSGGLGFGDTAYSANENAGIALGIARRKGKNKWMVVLDDRTVIGPLNSELSLSYSLRSSSSDAMDLAKSLNVSGTTLNRLLSVFHKLDGATVGAETLAQYLSMTERNARRLLGNLAANGMAVESGEETSGAGRPRKMYRIDLTKLRA